MHFIPKYEYFAQNWQLLICLPFNGKEDGLCGFFNLGQEAIFQSPIIFPTPFGSNVVVAAARWHFKTTLSYFITGRHTYHQANKYSVKIICNL